MHSLVFGNPVVQTPGMLRFGETPSDKQPVATALETLRQKSQGLRDLNNYRVRPDQRPLKRFKSVGLPYLLNRLARLLMLGGAVATIGGFGTAIYKGVQVDSPSGVAMANYQKNVAEPWQQLATMAQNTQGRAMSAEEQYRFQQQFDGLMQGLLKTLPQEQGALSNRVGYLLSSSDSQTTLTQTALHQMMTAPGNHDIAQFLAQQPQFQHLSGPSRQAMATWLQQSYAHPEQFGTNEAGQVGRILKFFSQNQVLGVDINEFAQANTPAKAQGLFDKILQNSPVFQQMSGEQRAQFRQHAHKTFESIGYQAPNPDAYLGIAVIGFAIGIVAMFGTMLTEEYWEAMNEAKQSIKAFRGNLLKLVMTPRQFLEERRARKKLELVILPVKRSEAVTLKETTDKTWSLVHEMSRFRDSAYYGTGNEEYKTLADQFLPKGEYNLMMWHFENRLHRQLLAEKRHEISQLELARLLYETVQEASQNRDYFPELDAQALENPDESYYINLVDKSPEAQALERLAAKQVLASIRYMQYRVDQERVQKIYYDQERAVSAQKTYKQNEGPEALKLEEQKMATVKQDLEAAKQLAEHALSLSKQIAVQVAEQMKQMEQHALQVKLKQAEAAAQEHASKAEQEMRRLQGEMARFQAGVSPGFAVENADKPATVPSLKQASA